jgi:hypothetical protein
VAGIGAHTQLMQLRGGFQIAIPHVDNEGRLTLRANAAQCLPQCQLRKGRALRTGHPAAAFKDEFAAFLRN